MSAKKFNNFKKTKQNFNQQDFIKTTYTTMKTKIKSTVALCLVAILTACTNYKPEKGNHYKDTEDTVKKDSVQKPTNLDNRDSVKKY